MNGERVRRIFVSGHNGMVGSAVCRAFESRGGVHLIRAGRDELDLRSPVEVVQFLGDHKPEAVVVAAARVGGIYANNQYPADFIFDNLMIAANLISASHNAGVPRLLFLGSSCIYPRMAAQPMAEDALMSGPLEPTNEPYSVAKIAGIKLCESYRRQFGRDYRSLMPTNLYGPGDNFHPEDSHVLPALMRRIDHAKRQSEATVVVWGTGAVRREFLHVDDLAAACMHFLTMEEVEYWADLPPQNSHINIGTGTDISIRELADILKDVIGYRGALEFDPTKPDGTKRKLLDIELAKTKGWRAGIPLRKGIASTYHWFKQNRTRARGMNVVS